MILYFKGGDEYLELHIDRENKKVKVKSAKTNYQYVDTKWQTLFDKGKEKEQEKLTDGLDDESFKITIIASMSQIGYQLQKAED